MKRVCAWRLGLGLALGVVAASTVARADDRASAEAAPRWSGTFQFAGGQAEKTGVDKAIDRSVAPLFFAIRGIARGKLEDRTRVAARMGFRIEGSNVRCSVPGAPDAVSPLDGTAVDYTVLGETVKLSQRRDGDRLVQTFASADGKRVNVIAPSADGTRVTMLVTVSSPRLPVPVTYGLTYARMGK